MLQLNELLGLAGCIVCQRLIGRGKARVEMECREWKDREESKGQYPYLPIHQKNDNSIVYSLTELALRCEMLQLAAFRYQPGRQSNR